MISKKNKGFTMVEIIIVLVIIAILAAIAIPVTLSIIDSSKEAEKAADAKNIWDATKSTFLEQLANEAHWVSTQDSNKANRQGIVLEQTSKRTDGSTKTYLMSDFEGCCLYIGDTVVAEKMLNKIEKRDNYEMIYVGTGRYNSYYDGDTPEIAYNVYALIYKYKDDDKLYFYDGSTVSTEWIFSNPSSAKAFKAGVKGVFIDKGSQTIELQFYCILNKGNITNKSGTLLYSYLQKM